LRKITVLLLLGGILLTVLSVQAQRPDAPEYGRPGPYLVGTQELTLPDEDRPLDVTIWYPAQPDSSLDEDGTTYTLLLLVGVRGQAVRDAQPATSDAPYPLVIYSHGSGSSRVLSLWLTEHLASHGYVVMAANHPGDDVSNTVNNSSDFPLNYAQRPLDVLRQLDLAADLNASGAFAGLIDVDRTAVIGHSFGGYTALSVGGAALNTDQMRDICAANGADNETFGEVCFLVPSIADIAEERGLETVPAGDWPLTTDPRIQAVVGLAPWNGPILSFNDYAKPTLLIVGGADRVTVPERDAFTMYRRITDAPAYLATLELADHYIFIDECPPALLTFGAFDACSDAVWDMTRAHDISRHLTTLFLNGYLRGDSAALNALTPAAVDFRGVRFEAQPGP